MPELGTKHECFHCGVKFYDLGKAAAVCPKCGANQKDAGKAAPAAAAAPRRRRREKPEPVEAAAGDDEEEIAEEPAAEGNEGVEDGDES